MRCGLVRGYMTCGCPGGGDSGLHIFDRPLENLLCFSQHRPALNP